MAKATPIPTASRDALAERDRGRCVRCGGRASAKHHRRSRSICDEHTHHPGNLVSLCSGQGGCHEWAHAHPQEAMALGLIVTRHSSDPCAAPWTGYYGTVQASCQGRSLVPYTG